MGELKVSIDIDILNELLNNKSKYIISTQKGYQGINISSLGDGVPGEYNKTLKFYQHPDFPQDVLLRETYHTDSYGDNDNLIKIEFVRAKSKIVTVYEPF